MRMTIGAWVVAAAVVCALPALSVAQGTDAPAAAPEAMPDTDVQWLWGEVVSVNPAANEFTVKYLDYEADIEKEITIRSDDKTTFENIKAIGELKPQDTVSIDYTVSDGVNKAKNISVEKPEAAAPAAPAAAAPEAPAPAPAVESAPNATAP